MTVSFLPLLQYLVPHHLSTKEEIESLIMGLKNKLTGINKPKLITIALSSSDGFDYTPLEQVKLIYGLTKAALLEVFGDIRFILDEALEEP